MNGKRWNAGCSLRIAPLQGAYPIRNESCRERPMCRSALFARYSATNGLHLTSILYSKSSRMSRGRTRRGEKNAGLRSAPRPRLLEKGLKIQNFPHKDLPCNAGRSLWGKFLGSRGLLRKKPPSGVRGKAPRPFSPSTQPVLYQLSSERFIARLSAVLYRLTMCNICILRRRRSLFSYLYYASK